MNHPHIRVVVVEDNASHREQFKDNLAADSSLKLVGEFWTVRDACLAVENLAPQVVLVDLELPDGTGFEVISHVRQVCPDAEIMVISVFGGEANLARAIAAGATGYLLKDCLPADFNSAIHALRAGESPISPPLARLLLKHYTYDTAASMAAPQAKSPLSQREIIILEQVARGINFDQIAQALFISPHTVKSHIKNVYRKLEAHSRPHAVYIARKQGWINP